MYKINEHYNNKIIFNKININLNNNLKINTLYTNNQTYLNGIIPSSYIPFYKSNKSLDYSGVYKVYDLRDKNSILLLSFFKSNDISINNYNNIFSTIKLDKESNFTNLDTLKQICINEINLCNGKIKYKSLVIYFNYKNNIFKYIINSKNTTLILLFKNDFKKNKFILSIFDYFNYMNLNISNKETSSSNYQDKKENVINFYKNKILNNTLNKY